MNYFSNYEDKTVAYLAKELGIGRNKLYSFLKWYKVMHINKDPVSNHLMWFSKRVISNNNIVYDLTSEGEEGIRSLIEQYGIDEVDTCYKKEIAYRRKLKAWNTELLDNEEAHGGESSQYFAVLAKEPKLHDQN